MVVPFEDRWECKGLGEMTIWQGNETLGGDQKGISSSKFPYADEVLDPSTKNIDISERVCYVERSMSDFLIV